MHSIVECAIASIALWLGVAYSAHGGFIFFSTYIYSGITLYLSLDVWVGGWGCMAYVLCVLVLFILKLMMHLLCTLKLPRVFFVTAVGCGCVRVLRACVC